MLILKYHKNTLPLSPKIGVFFYVYRFDQEFETVTSID